MTLRFIIYDPIELLKQNVKDRDIQPMQVAYWAVVLMNRLKAQHIEKRDSGRFLTTFPVVPVIVPPTTLPQGVVQNRKYVELPDAIFDFDKDGAIEYMAYTSDGTEGCPPEYTNVTFERTTPSTSKWLYVDPNTYPSPSRPYFSLSESKCTLYGVESIPITSVEMGIYMPIASPDKIDLDAEVDFPVELLAVLQSKLYDYGRFGLLIPPDRNADGEFQPQGNIPTNKIASVNQVTEQ